MILPNRDDLKGEVCCVAVVVVEIVSNYEIHKSFEHLNKFIGFDRAEIS